MSTDTTRMSTSDGEASAADLEARVAELEERLADLEAEDEGDTPKTSIIATKGPSTWRTPR